MSQYPARTPLNRTPPPKYGTTGGVIPYQPNDPQPQEQPQLGQATPVRALSQRSGTAGNPSPQAPGITTRVPPVNRDTTGASLFEPPQDTPQAWRGTTRPGAGPTPTPTATDTRARFDTAGRDLKVGAPATPGQNPNGVPGLYQPPKPDASMVLAQTTLPQSEANNPLTNAAAGKQPVTGGSVDVGQVMGFSRRGNRVPGGQDALPQDPNVGGNGLYARRFSNPTSASIYHNYVKGLFGDEEDQPRAAGVLARTGRDTDYD
jgi:hypothetical protein